MKKLIKAEMMKLFKSFPLKIIFLIMLALSFVTSISSLSYIGSPNLEVMEIALNGYDAFLSSLRDTPTIAIIGIIVIGLLVCNDFENRTIQMEIAAGHSRLAILFSKIISIEIAYALVFLPYPLGRAILQGVFISFGTQITIGIIFKMIIVFVTIILVGTAMNGLAILLAFVIRKSVIVMGVSFVLVVLGGNALLSFSYSNPTMGQFLAKTPLGLCKALAAGNYSSQLLLQAVSVSLICIGIFTALTYLLFRKAELK